MWILPVVIKEGRARKGRHAKILCVTLGSRPFGRSKRRWEYRVDKLSGLEGIELAKYRD